MSPLDPSGVANLAFKNLWRNRSRTLLTASMTFFGSFLACLTLAFGTGSYADIIDLITDSGLGDAQILKDSYQEKSDFYETLAFGADSSLKRFLDDSGVLYAPRSESAGVLASERESVGVLITGVDTERDSTVVRLSESVVEGSFLNSKSVSSETLPVVLGVTLASKLNASVGTELSFLGQGADGSLVAELFSVSGIFDLGSPDLNYRAIFIPLPLFQEIMVQPDQVHRLLLKESEGKPLPVEKIESFLERESPGVSVFSWNEMAPELATSIEADRRGNVVFLAFVLIVVLLGVSNTMMMSAFERTRETALLKALGTSNGRLYALFLLESFFLVGASSVLGAVLSVSLVPFLSISLGEEGFSWAGVVIREMSARNSFEDIAVVVVSVVAAALLASLLPVTRVIRMPVTTALREAEQ